MKRTTRTPFFAPAALLFMPTVLPLAGCGNNDVIKQDPAVAKKRNDAAVVIRQAYDKSNGNYDALSDADKATLDAVTGSAAHSKEAFGHMGPNPVSGGAVGGGGGLPASGPGAH